MKIGVIISTNDPEVVWNAFRFGNTALKEGHEIKIFLINKGVETEDIKSKEFNIKEQISSLIKDKGQILACGTCLKLRQKVGSAICPISTMKDLLEIVKESDKVLTFG